MQIAKLTKSILNIYVLFLLVASIGASTANYAAKKTFARFGGTPDSVSSTGNAEISNSIVVEP